LASVWSQLCVGTFGRNLSSVAVKMFSHLILFTKKFYKFCTFNVIFKDNTAINCITVQHKEGSFLSTMTTMLVILYLTLRSSVVARNVRIVHKVNLSQTLCSV
jgi:hypothetical protein